MRLGIVELLLDVEQRSDLPMQLRRDEELPARERERGLEDSDSLFDATSRELLLHLRHHRLELLDRAAREQDVRTDSGKHRGQDAAERVRQAGEVEGAERNERRGEREKQVDHPRGT